MNKLTGLNKSKFNKKVRSHGIDFTPFLNTLYEYKSPLTFQYFITSITSYYFIPHFSKQSRTLPHSLY